MHMAGISKIRYTYMVLTFLFRFHYTYKSQPLICIRLQIFFKFLICETLLCSLCSVLGIEGMDWIEFQLNHYGYFRFWKIEMIRYMKKEVNIIYQIKKEKLLRIKLGTQNFKYKLFCTIYVGIRYTRYIVSYIHIYLPLTIDCIENRFLIFSTQSEENI